MRKFEEIFNNPTDNKNLLSTIINFLNLNTDDIDKLNNYNMFDNQTMNFITEKYFDATIFKKLHNYYNNDKLLDKYHWGLKGFKRYIDIIMLEIDDKYIINDDDSTYFYVIADSTIDYSYISKDLDWRNELSEKIVEERKEYLITKFRTIGVNKVFIDAIGGTGYISSINKEDNSFNGNLYNYYCNNLDVGASNLYDLYDLYEISTNIDSLIYLINIMIETKIISLEEKKNHVIYI